MMKMKSTSRVRSVAQRSLLSGLLLICVCASFAAAVSVDLTELRNKVAKIKVNPRGNLWATGHFMGKKSVREREVLPEQTEPGDLIEAALRVALQETRDSPVSQSKRV
ncbi:neuromedin-B-like [Denticeps clupeoides]|nr:neuromedin-B-like [Denticeps clupeoides]